MDSIARITIIVPVFNEERGLHTFVKSAKEILFSRKDVFFEVLFIDDGSLDNSWNIIEKYAKENYRFSGIKLSRNFGPHVAISAGIDISPDTSDAIAIAPCDLQDPLEIIIKFYDSWKLGNDIVWGKRKDRNESKIKILVSNIFNTLFKKYAMPANSKFTTGTFLLMDKKVVNCYKKFKEKNRLSCALIAWTGFKQSEVFYSRKKRRHGKSGWTFSKMLRTFYDSFLSFSSLPSKIITFLSITILIFSFVFASYLIVKYCSGTVLPGWTGIMLLINVLFGLLFFILGLSFEYLERIYSETLSRPLYFVSKKTKSISK